MSLDPVSNVSWVYEGRGGRAVSSFVADDERDLRAVLRRLFRADCTVAMYVDGAPVTLERRNWISELETLARAEGEASGAY